VGSIFAYYLKFENWAFWEQYSTLQLFVKWYKKLWKDQVADI
jgi:hypothetical protein